MKHFSAGLAHDDRPPPMATAKCTAEIESETLKRIEQQMSTCTINTPSDGMVLYSNRRYYGEEGMIRPGATCNISNRSSACPTSARCV